MIGQLIDQKFETRQAFADALRISKHKVSHVVRGITPLRGAERERWANVLGVSPTALRPAPASRGTREVRVDYGGAGIGQRIRTGRMGFRIIPVYASIPAGVPGQSFSNAIDEIEIPEWGSDFDRWGHPVDGDSMLPQFQHGDIVVFENRKVEDYHAVHAIKDGEDIFKYWCPASEGTELRPGNPVFEPISAEGWEPIGVAVKLIRQLPHRESLTMDFPLGARWRTNHGS